VRPFSFPHLFLFIKLTALNAFRRKSFVNFLLLKRPKTFLLLSCLYSANIAATASFPNFVIPFEAVIWLKQTLTVVSYNFCLSMCDNGVSNFMNCICFGTSVYDELTVGSYFSYVSPVIFSWVIVSRLGALMLNDAYRIFVIIFIVIDFASLPSLSFISSSSLSLLSSS